MGVRMGHPYCYGESICSAAERHGNGPREVYEEGGNAIRESCVSVRQPTSSSGCAEAERKDMLWTSVRGERDGYWASAWATSL